MGKGSEYSLGEDEPTPVKPKTEDTKVETPKPAIVTPVPGAFVASLKRNNAKIRDDRATAIAEDAQLVYKRAVEDLEMNIKKMRRDRENMLDMSPTDAQSLVLASDFNSGVFTQKDIDLGVKIRNAEITLEIARKQYEYLFGA
jgi:hypothetical protein